MTDTIHSDFYRVTINVDPEKSQSMIDAAVQLGAKKVFIVRARGVLHKKKVGMFTMPAISPSFDVLNLFVPAGSLQGVLQHLVAVGQLDRFGAGSIYASRIDHLLYNNTELFEPGLALPKAEESFEFQTNLVAINCICQLDHAEEIAHSAMTAGSPSPTISYGYGHGIRDRLGPFLQLTINPKKEFIELVVGAEEAERILEIMVQAGHLDQPAQGFIFTRPIETGMINTLSFQESSLYPATLEQIIKAIDQMQGNTNWRRTGTVMAPVSHRKKLRDLVSLNCIINRGFGDLCSIVAMEAGASGTSTYYANAVPIVQDHPGGFVNSDEREMIALTIGAGQVEAVIKALKGIKELEGTPMILFSYPAPEAVTYLK